MIPAIKSRRPGIVRFCFIVCGIALAVALSCFIHKPSYAFTSEDIVARSGCAMAHCDPEMSDNVHLSPPMSDEVVPVWRDTSVTGSVIGIGCSSNGQMAVCSFASTTSKPADLRAYDLDGKILWTSTAFSNVAHVSAPLISRQGRVIAADQYRIMRFTPTGQTVWKRATAGGLPISPSVTDNGEIILATALGPISAYSYTTGDTLTQLRLDARVVYSSATYTGFFHTINTPAIKGNRIYVSTEFKYGSTGQKLPIGRLYAVDLIRTSDIAYKLQVAWYFQFKAPSGSSPALGSDAEGNTVIFFDGSGIVPGWPDAPQAFAVRDLGTRGVLLWRYALASRAVASPARDPRGGVWFYATRRPELLRLSEEHGYLLQRINIDTLITDSGLYVPAAVMTIAGTADEPVMVVSAATGPQWAQVYVVAIDLTVDPGRLLWKYRVDEGKGLAGVPQGQFPILINSAHKPVVVFTTNRNGIWALTSPE